VVEALDAIVEAHAAGIVHRDLKPSNLFLAQKPDGTRRVKVLDFGISKIADAAAAPDAALTTTKSLLGSPGYMSPEQVRSTKNVDARTDIWALGVILYELLTGEPAFTGETLGDVFAKIREDDLQPIRERRPDVPEGLAEVLGLCLQRNRDKRLADAALLRAKLQPFATGEAVAVGAVTTVEPRRTLESAMTVAAPDASAPTSPRDSRADGGEVKNPRLAGETLATWSGEGKGGGASRTVLFAGVAAVALAGAIGAWMFGRGPSASAIVTASASASANAAPIPTPAESSAGSRAEAPVVTPSGPVTASPIASTSATATAIPVIKPPPRALPPRSTATASTPAAPPPKKREDLGI
jgi:serine/threonine-protein kinase